MKTPELLERAARATISAQLLLDANDPNGACNRAYYAMFDAARAALQSAVGDPQPERIKTHTGLISEFSVRLVKSGFVSTELGRSLSKVADIRLIADYSDEEVPRDKAAWAIEQASAFVEAMRGLIAARRDTE
jgi:uncharacterized protein (UPF0332 family)